MEINPISQKNTTSIHIGTWINQHPYPNIFKFLFLPEIFVLFYLIINHDSTLSRKHLHCFIDLVCSQMLAQHKYYIGPILHLLEIGTILDILK